MSKHNQYLFPWQDPDQSQDQDQDQDQKQDQDQLQKELQAQAQLEAQLQGQGQAQFQKSENENENTNKNWNKSSSESDSKSDSESKSDSKSESKATATSDVDVKIDLDLSKLEPSFADIKLDDSDDNVLFVAKDSTINYNPGDDLSFNNISLNGEGNDVSIVNYQNGNLSDDDTLHEAIVKNEGNFEQNGDANGWRRLCRGRHQGRRRRR